jgi:hypothetical protein
MGFGNRLCPPYHAVGFERLIAEGLEMKKLVLALTALAAFTGSATAADLVMAGSSVAALKTA